MAKWSKADSKRRASIRKQSQFVTPSLPPLLPQSLPSSATAATNLMRRTSTIIRRKTINNSSSNRRKSNNEEEEEEGNGIIELRSSTGSRDSNKSRKNKSTMRKESLVLSRGRDGFVSPDSVLELPLETPPISPRLPRTSTSTNESTGSRFIEDLQQQQPSTTTSLSPPPPASRNSTSSSTATTIERNPFSPPPTSKNPFADSTITINSFDSISSNGTATLGNGVRGGGGGGQEPSNDDENRPNQPLFYQIQPLPNSPPLVVPSPHPHPTRHGHEHDDEEFQDLEVRNSVGWLDWLLCGCWRPRGWDSYERGGEGEAQQGRTNPNE